MLKQRGEKPRHSDLGAQPTHMNNFAPEFDNAMEEDTATSS